MVMSPFEADRFDLGVGSLPTRVVAEQGWSGTCAPATGGSGCHISRETREAVRDGAVTDLDSSQSRARV